MGPSKPSTHALSNEALARQLELDRSYDALRQDYERANRAKRRVEQQAQPQNPRGQRSQLPYYSQEKQAQAPAEQMPFPFDHDIPADQISPKSRPEAQPRSSSFELRWGKSTQQKAPQQYRPATPSDPSRFQLSPIRETPISAPLMPHLYDMRVHVDQDPSQQYQTFEFDMQFKIRMAPGLPKN